MTLSTDDKAQIARAVAQGLAQQEKGVDWKGWASPIILAALGSLWSLGVVGPQSQQKEASEANQKAIAALQVSMFELKTQNALILDDMDELKVATQLAGDKRFNSDDGKKLNDRITRIETKTDVIESNQVRRGPRIERIERFLAKEHGYAP
jgi:hypothetical protein